MKIFEIGLGRTGTGSVAQAMRRLGFRVLHWGARFHTQMVEELSGGRMFSCLEAYDYVGDCVAPWFRELDQAYPEAKFVLTVRDEQSWLRSFTEHALRQKLRPQWNFVTLYRLQKFGFFNVENDADRLLRSYRRHREEVRRYFADRPDKLLEFDVCNGDGWKKLCGFVDRPVPQRPFPHAHARSKETTSQASSGPALATPSAADGATKRNGRPSETAPRVAAASFDPALPAVSCMCLTYGRPQVLEEAIESFLRQNYAGRKELLVLNDCTEQTLVCDAPDVRIVNVANRFRTVGEKRNACAALAAHDLLFVWDDDDIYLPHRLSFSVAMLGEREFFKPSKAFTLQHGTLGGPKSNLFHSGSCFTRSLFDRARGYAHMGSGQDAELEEAFARLIGHDKNYNAIRPHEIYYLYRWGGTGSYHLSGFGRDRADKPSGNDRVGEYVRRQLAADRIPQGTLRLEPQWRLPYDRLVRDYLADITSGKTAEPAAPVREAR